MSVHKIENPYISTDLRFFRLTCLVFAAYIPFHKTRSSRLQAFFKIGALKSFAIFTGKLSVGVYFL